jgi:cellulase
MQGNVKPAAAAGKCSFEAGDTVTIEMHQQTNSRDCKTEGIGGAHWGPVMAYMGKVEDAASADGSGEFFKVYENGWAKAPGSSQGDADFWGTKDLNYNCGKLDFKIPSDIAPGDYLLRAEAVALHAASSAGGAQHYVTCYQLTVTGSGTLTPKGVKFPEAYSKTGPGLGFSIHAPLDSYPMPGPELIASGTKSTPQLLTFGTITGAPAAGNGSPKPASSSKVAAPTSSTAAIAPASSSVIAGAVTTPVANSTVAPTPSAAPVVPSSVPALTPPVMSSNFSMTLAPAPSTLATSTRPQPTQGGNNGVSKEWAQCGGQGFQGASACASGLVCKDWNPYYSQCIKSEGGANAPTAPQAPSSPQAPSYPQAPSSPQAPSTPQVPSSPQAPSAPAASSPAAEPVVVAPSENEPAEKTYTLETFIAFLEKNAGSESAAKIRRMIEALQ